MKKEKFFFIKKTVFLPDKGILVVGDLHLGYESMLKESGINLPETQIKNMINDFKKIFLEIEDNGDKLNKIIFLGDIKHYFGFFHREKYSFNKLFNFLKKKINEENIIIIKGNHDKIDYGKKAVDYHLEGGIAFLHGNKKFVEVFDKKIKMIVMGHLHPSIIISDKHNIKREKFKCFLFGEYLKKQILVLPSFLDIVEGTNVNEYSNKKLKEFAIIPIKNILNFNIYVIGEKETYNFGKIKDID